jgi:prevent-host-death family protein
MYMNTIPVADARANLSKLIDEASTTHERTEITKNGRRAAVLIGVDDYDAMRETIAVLSVTNLLRSHAEGQRALSTAETLDAEQLAIAIDRSGRRVNPSKTRYQLLVAGPAANDLTDQFTKKVAAAAFEFMNGALLDDPRRVGTPLGASLAPAYSARRGDYQILYLIDSDARTVNVTAIRHSADAFHS